MSPSRPNPDLFRSFPRSPSQSGTAFVVEAESFAIAAQRACDRAYDIASSNADRISSDIRLVFVGWSATHHWRDGWCQAWEFRVTWEEEPRR